MNHFIVKFRFKNDEDYSKRYQSFIDKIHEIVDGYEWDETSSFFAFKASCTAQGICNNLYIHTGFDSSKDMMVVIDLDNVFPSLNLHHRSRNKIIQT